MTQEEIERRCEDAVTHTGDKTMSVVVMLLAGLEYDIHEWIHNGQSNLDELELSIGNCYVGLKLLEKYVHANPAGIQNGIEDALRRN